MLNPWAPARYGIWVENTSFDPDHPGKWNGIKLSRSFFNSLVSARAQRAGDRVLATRQLLRVRAL